MRSKATSLKFSITFDTQMKIALFPFVLMGTVFNLVLVYDAQTKCAESATILNESESVTILWRKYLQKFSCALDLIFHYCCLVGRQDFSICSDRVHFCKRQVSLLWVEIRYVSEPKVRLLLYFGMKNLADILSKKQLIFWKMQLVTFISTTNQLDLLWVSNLLEVRVFQVSFPRHSHPFRYSYTLLKQYNS